ncbi:MAG: hypothetical protein NC223_05545 [Butyrivibrio sp.]|nr:hypothetical protein [Butyrivibrio sp.]
MFNEKMTVYNHTETEGKEVWQRTVVDHIMWRHGKKHTEIVQGVMTSTTVESVTVDFERGRNADYLTPAQFERCEDKAAHWTLDAESNMDILVLGECEAEISGDYTVSRLLKDYKGNCGTVKSVADSRNMPMLQHIRVVLQ